MLQSAPNPNKFLVSKGDLLNQGNFSNDFNVHMGNPGLI